MVPFDIARSVFQARYWFAAFMGAFFSLITWKILNLDFRYTLAISGGIIVLSMAMIAIYYLTDFLVYALVFNVSFAVFSKWLFLQHLHIPARGISIGIAEIVIALAFIVWFAQIFIARTETLPNLGKFDVLVILYILSQLISLIAAPNKSLGIFDIVYNVKHLLICYFIAYKIKRHHLKWLVILFLFAILFESSLAYYERFTGNVSIGVTKGNVESSSFGAQFAIPGIEHKIRSAGTTIDPHSLGLYYSMLLPIPFILMMVRGFRPGVRCALAVILLIGILGDILTFSRSGWLSFTIASFLAMGIIVFIWKQGSSIFIVLALALSLLALSSINPQIYENVYTKLFESPSGLLESRYKLNWTALDIWSQHLLFGYGPGNYEIALSDPNVTVYGADEGIVHNLFLHIAAEKGLFGLISYYGIIFFAMFRCVRLLKCEDLLIRGLALAILTAFVGYLLDGLTDPLGREAVPYAQLYVYIGISMSFDRLLKKQTRYATTTGIQTT